MRAAALHAVSARPAQTPTLSSSPASTPCLARAAAPLSGPHRAQIDCVTVKGSNQAMGLFTYDVTLERVPPPAPRDPVAATLAAAAAGLAGAGWQQHGGHAHNGGHAHHADAGERTAPPDDADADTPSHSLCAYDQEFMEHPDLVATWAVDEAFLARFAQGFAAYRRAARASARCVSRAATGRRIMQALPCHAWRGRRALHAACCCLVHWRKRDCCHGWPRLTTCLLGQRHTAATHGHTLPANMAASSTLAMQISTFHTAGAAIGAQPGAFSQRRGAADTMTGASWCWTGPAARCWDTWRVLAGRRRRGGPASGSSQRSDGLAASRAHG